MLRRGDHAVRLVRTLRKRRLGNRLANIDWFEAIYRAYITGLGGGALVLLASGYVRDEELTGLRLADALELGPRVLGLVVVAAVLSGLRSGAAGGPISVESGDVVHLMLAPLPRRMVLMRPALQRVRSLVFMGTVAGAIVGQFAARRLPEAIPPWAAAGAAFGATVALLWGGCALVAHSLRLSRTLASGIGLTLLGWQAFGAARGIPGPGDSGGRLAFWAVERSPADLVTSAVAVVLVVAGLAGLGRTSLEALQRRSGLISQLRFAATMQDLRTVVLLRRLLGQEHARLKPLIRLRPRQGGRQLVRATWRRGWHGLMRTPTSRLVRMAILAAGVGAGAAMAFRGTSPAIVLSGFCAFVFGLELLEPLSQELDQPDLHASLPVSPGALALSHLLAPLVAMIPFAVVTAAAAAMVGGGRLLVPFAILSYPMLAGAMSGSAVSIGKTAPNEVGPKNTESFVPPEMAGAVMAARLLRPPLMSVAAVSVVFLLRLADERSARLVPTAVVLFPVPLLLLVIAALVLVARPVLLRFLVRVSRVFYPRRSHV